MPGEVEERSPEEDGDEVVRRNKNALGLGGDVLAEMKVKQEKNLKAHHKKVKLPRSCEFELVFVIQI